MDFLYSLFLGAGTAGFAYSRMGRRLGYGNTGSIWTVVAIIFILATIFFYTILKFILNI